jgi:hypothetical protein
MDLKKPEFNIDRDLLVVPRWLLDEAASYHEGTWLKGTAKSLVVFDDNLFNVAVIKV